jgi:hypothetical protein
MSIFARSISGVDIACFLSPGHVSERRLPEGVVSMVGKLAEWKASVDAPTYPF